MRLIKNLFKILILSLLLSNLLFSLGKRDDSYTLTTSYVCFDDSGGTPIRVSFVTPPSEYVEIEVIVILLIL